MRAEGGKGKETVPLPVERVVNPAERSHGPPTHESPPGAPPEPPTYGEVRSVRFRDGVIPRALAVLRGGETINALVNELLEVEVSRREKSRDELLTQLSLRRKRE